MKLFFPADLSEDSEGNNNYLDASSLANICQTETTPGKQDAPPKATESLVVNQNAGKGTSKPSSGTKAKRTSKRPRNH